MSDEVKEQAVAVRASLEASGLDHGPISVHEKMHAMGLEHVPSTASLARVFREAGVARLEPKKKPRSAWRRFVYPAPNACWQLDTTEYVLSHGRKCVIFQLIDDHSRYALASHVAFSETAKDAITVVDKAIAAHGVRRDTPGQPLVGTLGVVDVVERVDLGLEFGQRLRDRLLVEVAEQRLMEAFVLALGGRFVGLAGDRLHAQSANVADESADVPAPRRVQCGPVVGQEPLGLTAWEASPKADPPRPGPDRPLYEVPVPSRHRLPRAQPPADLPAGTRVRTVGAPGTIGLDSVTYMIDVRRTFEQVLVVSDGDKIIITDLQGEVLAEHTRPAPGITYVGNGRPRGPRPKTGQPSPMS